jgi:hypothetical protein
MDAAVQFIGRAWSWFFAAPKRPIGPWRVITWWELRRIPFNLVIGSWGIVCLVVFYLVIEGSGHLKPGEDAVEPMALFTAPFLINGFYTLGWIVELAVRWFRPVTGQDLGPRLFKLGLGFSLFLISLPAITWFLVLVFEIVQVRLVRR